MDAYQAMVFAREAHKDQRRKYTNNPYTDHLAEVAGIVATVAKEVSRNQWCDPQCMIAVAWLHDCMEDQGVKKRDLEDKFDLVVAHGVFLLSDLDTGNRADRKVASRTRLAGVDGWVQTIKVADLISNTASIVQHDPKFAAVYLEEKRLLLDVLTKAEPRLMSISSLA